MFDDFEALEAAWERSDALFALLRPDGLLERPIPLHRPFLFYLGHLPAFAWSHIGVALLEEQALDTELDELFARGIHPEDAAAAAAERRVRWPSVDRVASYRDRVRARIRSSVSRLLEHEDPYARQVLPLVIEHECRHHEALLYMIARVPTDALLAPASWEPAVSAPSCPPVRHVQVSGGRVTLAARRDVGRFGWNDEPPEREARVSDFELDDRPVTVADWRSFLDSGAYRNPKLWLDEDWSWRRREGINHPDAWRRTDGGWRVRSLFEWHDVESVGGWPVYVSLAEARAWCRWAGRRLPTEAELHLAAFREPAPLPRGSDFSVKSPLPVDDSPPNAQGLYDLIGNGWEWTSTELPPQAGFTAHLRSQPSDAFEVFEGRHFVVVGCSWATDRRLIRRSFRNGYPHHYPYVWATFRTAAGEAA